MKSKLLENITPGEILEEDFLKPMGLSQYRLAQDIGVPPRRVNEIVKGERAITADTALRLGRYFKMSTQFWLNLQSHHELEIVEEQLVLARFLPPCRSKIIVRACHFFGRWTRNRQNHKINQLPELTYENKTLVIRAIVDCVTGFAGACRQSGSGNHRCLQDAL